MVKLKNDKIFKEKNKYSNKHSLFTFNYIYTFTHLALEITWYSENNRENNSIYSSQS